MPSRLTSSNLVARPDRVDFRDRSYLPPLRSLPPVWPPKDLIKLNLREYRKYILNQGALDACTGFGLAAVINFIYWSTWREKKLARGAVAGTRPKLVSQHMLYHNARLYDEWEGSDYDGSSCRGAMKGWHKHGVCDMTKWQLGARKQKGPWQLDAALRPLGAYYRIDAKSIADMQAAIFEVRSVYCSAEVHGGWDKPKTKTTIDGVQIARIDFREKNDGGHAFALVGYTSEGFIVQNSWGPDWGTNGFALLTYQDWIKNGYDAWVAAVGAPMQAKSPATAGRSNLVSSALAQDPKTFKAKSGKTPAVKQWTEEEAYRHSIVVGNNGKLIQKIIGAASAEDALDIVLSDEVAAGKKSHLAIYVHGGLNDEEAAITRARCMGPWFEANDIHPIFLVWRTGIVESLSSIAADEIKKYEEQVKSIRSKGLGEWVEGIVDKLSEAKDRAFEVAAEKLIGKAVWSQIKQNAAMAAAGGGVQVLQKIVQALNKAGKPSHLLGHSAGSLVIGHLLDAAAGSNIKTCGLYAPACSLAFAVDKFGTALKQGGPLAGGKLHIDFMTDKAETDDTVGPYGKSLLYLVSRALEDYHKVPLLGLELATDPKNNRNPPSMSLKQPEAKADLTNWRQNVAGKPGVSILAHAGPKIRTSTEETQQIAHGTFDNDIDIVNASLKRILGKTPPVPITDLRGF